MKTQSPTERAYSELILQMLYRAEVSLVRSARNGRIRELINHNLNRPMRPEVIHQFRTVITDEARYGEYPIPSEVPLYVHIEPEMEAGRLSFNIYIPLYKHDCEECDYIGRFTDDSWRGEETWDLYTCMKAGYRTFICRYGDDGPDYASCPEPALPGGVHPALFECVRRWYKAAGL